MYFSHFGVQRGRLPRHLFSRLDLSAYLKSISLIMTLMSSSIKLAIMGR